MTRRLSRTVLTCVLALVLPVVALACSGGAGAEPDATPTCPSLVIPDTCPTGAADADAPSAPSWKKDVEPLIEKYCISCHSPGGIGESTEDYSTYEGVKKAGTIIGQQVNSCAMPLADAGAQPTPAERVTLITWALVCRAPNN
jgi:hypothetical protein